MCYFLTITIPASREALLTEAFARGFGVFATRNPSLEVAFPPSHRMYLLTTGMCSCGLYFDPETVEPPKERESGTAKKRANYQRRGWSAAKIDRAIENSQSHQSIKPTPGGLRADIRASLADLFEETGEGGLFAHFYNNEEIETFRFPNLRERKCAIEEFRQGAVELLVDMVLLIKRGSRN